MNIIIFGATGSIGRPLVDQALADGHTVTAFVRNPDALVVDHPNLIRLARSVFDQAAVTAALAGQDAAVVALGAGRNGRVRAEGTRTVIAAMQATGVRRLVCLSTLGAGDSRPALNFFWRHVMFGLLLRPAYADHQAQEAAVMASGLDWTIVRPGSFTDGPATDGYHHGTPPRDRKLVFKISRADVAGFMLRQIGSDTYLRQTPAVSH